MKQEVFIEIFLFIRGCAFEKWKLKISHTRRAKLPWKFEVFLSSRHLQEGRRDESWHGTREGALASHTWISSVHNGNTEGFVSTSLHAFTRAQPGKAITQFPLRVHPLKCESRYDVPSQSLYASQSRKQTRARVLRTSCSSRCMDVRGGGEREEIEYGKGWEVSNTLIQTGAPTLSNNWSPWVGRKEY